MKTTDILKIIASKKYVLRNGLTTTELRKCNNNTNYIYEAKVYEPEHTTPTFACWKHNGRFLADNIDHRLDIIHELKN